MRRSRQVTFTSSSYASVMLRAQRHGYSHGDMQRSRRHATFMATCYAHGVSYAHGDMLRSRRHATLTATCYAHGDMLCSRRHATACGLRPESLVGRRYATACVLRPELLVGRRYATAYDLCRFYQRRATLPSSCLLM